MDAVHPPASPEFHLEQVWSTFSSFQDFQERKKTSSISLVIEKQLAKKKNAESGWLISDQEAPVDSPQRRARLLPDCAEAFLRPTN